MTLRLTNRLTGIWLCLALCLCATTSRSSSDKTGDQILGRWLFPTKGSSVDVFRSGNRYFARVAEVDVAGQQNFGLAKNKIIITNLVFDGQAWSGGEMIHPKTGNHLDVELVLNDPRTITVTIYKGIKLLRKKFEMTRPMN